MEIITTSSRGQIVIPESIRKKHKIKEGTKLVLIEQGDRLVLEKEEKVDNFLKQRLDIEEKSWVTLAEKSLNEIWANEKDEKTWKKYL